MIDGLSPWKEETYILLHYHYNNGQGFSFGVLSQLKVSYHIHETNNFKYFEICQRSTSNIGAVYKLILVLFSISHKNLLFVFLPVAGF